MLRLPPPPPNLYPPGRRKKASDKIQVPLHGLLQDAIRRPIPKRLVQDFNFDWAPVPRLLHGLPNAPQLDDTVAHHAAAGQDARQWHGPVRHVVAEDAAGSAPDILVEARVPPHVKDVDHDAGMGWLELQRQIQGLGQGYDHAAIGRVHRMQWLYAQAHAPL